MCGGRRKPRMDSGYQYHVPGRVFNRCDGQSSFAHSGRRHPHESFSGRDYHRHQAAVKLPAGHRLFWRERFPATGYHQADVPRPEYSGGN